MQRFFLSISFILAALLFYPFGLVYAEKASLCSKCDSIESCSTKGHRAYANGEFLDSASLYNCAITFGAKNGHMFYNAGNAFYRAGQIGNAISSFRIALLYFPRDPDIRANLALARTKATDKIESSQDITKMVGLSFLLSLRDSLNVTELSYITLFLYCAFWLLFALKRIWLIKFINLFLAIVFILLSVFSVVLFGTRYGRDGSAVFALAPGGSIQTGVIITPEDDKSVNVYSGDSENFQVVFILHDGAEVEIPEVRDNWVAILLPNGERGWVRRYELKIIGESL